MKITIYTAKGCPDCYALKQWLNYKNIPYTEIDIEKPGISDYLKNKYGLRVAPITVIEDKFFYGTFDMQKPQLEAILKGGSMRIYVNGMSCQHCKIAVEKAFSAIEGVDSVNVNLESAYADVELKSSVDDKKFIEALEDTAYEVVKIEK